MILISEASGEIKTLVEKYQRVLAEGKEGEFNEERVKLQFINPFLEALGWDVSGKELIDEVKPEHQTIVGPVDFSLMINGKEKIFFEIKKFSEELSGSRTVRGKKQSYAEQALYYAWHKKVDWAVLTNFKEIRLYYTHVKKPPEGLIFKATFDEYLTPQKLSKIWLLSKEAVSSGLLDREEKRRTRKDIDAAVLEDLFESRKLLTNDVYGKYRGIDTELMKEGIQRILNRLIVMRFMEDKGIEQSEALGTLFDTYNSTVTNKDAVPFMRYLEPKFLEFNETYNSKVFEPHICDKFAISNRSFGIIIKILYKYNFDLIDADVLGNIYEDYLGHVLEGKGRRGVEIVEKRTKRKEHGIYYTPTYVVDYIVRNTVGALIEEKKQAILKQKFGGKDEKLLNDEEKKELGKALLPEINKIKILDPACGSGSFLIKAFDVVKEYYDAYEENSLSVMTTEKKILLNNIHGVDLDRQATEIASVNLILKALKKGQKLPLILDENIKGGNSLISGSEDELRKYFGDNWEEKKPFNWEEEFQEIFANKGFDVVIGNPPYGASFSKDIKQCLRSGLESAKGEFDSYALFIEQSLSLLKNGGILSFIIPDTILMQDRFEAIREIILNVAKINAIVSLGAGVFKDSTVNTVIIVLTKEANDDLRKNNEVEIYNTNKPGRDLEYGTYTKISIKQDLFYKPPFKLTIYIDEATHSILSKIEADSIPLAEIAKCRMGIKTGDVDYFVVPYQKYPSLDESTKKYCKKLVRGEDISRYNQKKIVNNPKWYIIYDTDEMLARCENARPRFEYKDEFLEPKIILRKIVGSEKRRIQATFDEEQYFPQDTVYMITISNEEYDIKYILALMNSLLLNYWFSKECKAIHVLATYLNPLPIHRIDFSNSEEKAIHDELVALAQRMFILSKQHNETLDVFKKILENMSDSKTDSWSLKDYFPSSDYGISPVESKKLIDIRSIGKVTKLEVLESGNDIIIRGEYFLGEKDKGHPVSDDILLIHFTDLTLKRFFYYSIKTFLLENSKKKVWGRGKIVDVVLKAIKVPRFYNLKMKDVETIRHLMAEFSKASPIGDKSLSEVEKEIAETDMTIDKKVYDLYGLTDEEIRAVEGK